MWNKASVFLKEQWWLLLIIVVILAMSLVPTQGGLPSSDYSGCETNGSACQYTIIKSITKESDGSATIIVPIKDDTKSTDLDLHLKKFSSKWLVGNTVYLNLPPDGDKMYLFVGYRSNMLATFFWRSLNASTGATAIIDINTRQEIVK